MHIIHGSSIWSVMFSVQLLFAKFNCFYKVTTKRFGAEISAGRWSATDSFIVKSCFKKERIPQRIDVFEDTCHFTECIFNFVLKFKGSNLSNA